MPGRSADRDLTVGSGREEGVSKSDPRTFRRHIYVPAFACQYARAREAQGDGFDDEIIETREKIANGDLDANVGRVIIDSLKWQAGKRVPKRYGDRVAHVGPDDGAIKLEGKPPDTLETARWIADMLLTAEAAKAKADDDEGNQE